MGYWLAGFQVLYTPTAIQNETLLIDGVNLFEWQLFHCDEIARLVDWTSWILDQNGGIWLTTFVLCRSLLTAAERFLAGVCALITSYDNPPRAGGRAFAAQFFVKRDFWGALIFGLPSVLHISQGVGRPRMPCSTKYRRLKDCQLFGAVLTLLLRNQLV